MIRGSVAMLQHSFCLKCIVHFAPMHHENLQMIGVEGDRKLTVQGTRSRSTCPYRAISSETPLFRLTSICDLCTTKIIRNSKKEAQALRFSSFSKRHKQSTVLHTDKEDNLL